MTTPSASTLLNRFTAKAKFRHMQVLIKLTELGSMRRAAQAVNMTQPAVSQMVSELERLVETELFFRHARGVEPTAATRELLPVAQRILDALEDGSETVANRLMEQDGVVKVASSPAARGALIHGNLDTFAEAHPRVQVLFTDNFAGNPLGGIAEASADVVCTREPAVTPEGWAFERCLDDVLTAVCGHNHPLADKDPIVPDDLGKTRWLLNRVGSVARSRFEELSLAHDWPQSVRCQIVMHIPELTKEMLLTGKYVAIMPSSVAVPWLASGEVRILKTEIDTPLAPIGLLWNADRAGPATAAFVAHIKASAQRN